MITGETKTGFVFSYDPALLDDMRVVDVLAVLCDEAANPFARITACSRATEMLLGKDLKDALYAHIGASHGGRVPFAKLEAELMEIMGAAGKDAEKN